MLSNAREKGGQLKCGKEIDMKAKMQHLKCLAATSGMQMIPTRKEEEKQKEKQNKTKQRQAMCRS